jgi:hypothetical protein
MARPDCAQRDARPIQESHRSIPTAIRDKVLA